MLAQASADLLTGDEQRLLQRTPTASLATERWTAADLPLLDEAQAQLADPPRRFGHIVVDEAQDVSAMALRMVARRISILDGHQAKGLEFDAVIIVEPAEFLTSTQGLPSSTSP
jgi:superfamily I DNA/RNA helicase